MIKLYRFPYSCYALKVQYLLDALHLDYTPVDVPFAERSELVELTGGRVVVPALDHDGEVVVESRDICQYLLNLQEHTLVPEPLEAVIWAYSDWCDSTLEDVLFRLASPGIQDRFETRFEKALFAFIKERKFGAGCIEKWRQDEVALVDRAQALLAPSLAVIRRQGFVAGERLTFADISLLGHLAMVAYADPALVAVLSDQLPEYMVRLSQAF